MKKVGIFSGYYPPHLGGIERYVDKLSTALEKLGYSVVVVTSNHGKLLNHEKSGDRTIYRLPTHKFTKNRYPIPRLNAEYKNLIRQIEDENIDQFIVNTRFHLTSLVGAKMGKRLGRPVFLIDHGTGHFTVNNHILDYFGKFYEHALTSYLKKYVDKYYGVSKKCNLWLGHFSIKASGVFYNAIDISDKEKVKNTYMEKYPASEIIITYAGRLIKEKGILNLLEAFSNYKKKDTAANIKLVIAGDGELFEYIRQNYKDSFIDMLGRLDFEEVMALYKRTDIFVYPSLYPEGLPTSILEAGLMDCAIIATPRGGTEEVIIDSLHGIITDGSASDLEKVIGQLVASSRARKELAENVSRRVESVFNWDTVARQVEREINSVSKK